MKYTNLIRVLREVIKAIEETKGYDYSSWKKFSDNLDQDLRLMLDLLLASDLSDHEVFSRINQSTDQIKKNRKYKLLNMLSNVLVGGTKISSKNKLRKDRYLVHIQFHCMSILSDLNLEDSAIWFANKNIKEAIRLDLTIITLDTARYLTRYYSRRKLDPKAAEKFMQISSLYKLLLDAELEIEQLYNQVVKKQANINSIRTSLNTISIPPYNPTYGALSQFYIRHHGLIRIYRSEIQGKTEEVLKLSHYYYSQFEKKRYDHKMLKGIFLIRKVDAHLKLKQYLEAQQTIKLLFTKINSSTTNWFDALDVQIRLSISIEDYIEAFEQITRLFKSKTYSSIPNTKKDLYQLYALYINFLVRTGHIQNAIPWSKRKTTAYFRSTTVFDRDTRGVRVAMIIAELLYNILDQDYDAMERRILSLKEYCSRYLKKNNENYRSNCFIKMLLEIPKSNYHPVAATRNAARYHQKLLNHPLEIAMQPREVEIVPFEQLWHIIIHYLRSPKRKRKNAMELSAFDL